MKQRAGVVLVSGLFLVAATCHDDDAEEVKAYKVHSGLEDVQIAPRPAATPEDASRSFQLSAWYRDDSRNVVAGPGPLSWTLQLTGGITDPSGEVTISAFPTAGSTLGEARVGDGSLTDAVAVRLWANSEAARSDGDVLQLTEPASAATGSENALANPPSIALVERRTSDGCQWSRPLAFVGALSVGEQTTIPCSISLFSPGKGMSFQDHITDPTWLEKGASFSLASGEPHLVEVTVFLAVTPSAAAGQAATQQPQSELAPDPKVLAQLDVQRANQIFEDSRAGVKIHAEYIPVPLSSDLSVRVGADPYDCVVTPMLPSDPNQDGYLYNPHEISVYYVDRINYPPDPVHPRVRGIQCHHWYSGNPAVGSPPGKGPVIFISYSHHSPVTLAHEIGHALGLNDEEGRLGNRDVMHNLLPDGPLGANARSHLSIGQAFRMNRWDDSWINTRIPKPPQRACDTGQPCPPIGLDPDDY